MQQPSLFGFLSGFLFLCLLHLPACAPQKNVPMSQEDGLELIILHTNDTHAHAAGIDKYGNIAFEQSKSRGGAARIAAAIRQAKADSDNVLALDAGDQLQGTLFYSVNKWAMQAELNKHLPYDAITLGNHEFDEGCEELARYLEQISIPVVAANLTPAEGCPLRGGGYAPWRVMEVRGHKVAVVGIANDEVRALAKACPKTAFKSASATLSGAVRELEGLGVRHIIALTHSGLPADRELARNVDGIDVIVGGHTHSYLGPDSEEGPYPIVERSPNGQPVLVVTAKRATQYLGELRVGFDAAGVPLHWQGAPRELAADMPLDATVAAVVEKYVKTLDSCRAVILGSHNLDFPDGMEACRSGDCLGGMITTDAMLEYARPHGVRVALCNGGGLRAALPAGKISRGDVLGMLPFGNILVLREYSGAQLRAALEHGVAEDGAKGPRLLQVAGLRYVIDGVRPAGQRIVRIEMLNREGKALPLDDAALYRVILPDYLARGGDGYVMLKESRTLPSPDPIDVDIVENYIKKHSPLPMPTTGRIAGRQ